MNHLSVLIVDDEPLARRRLRRLLDQQAGVELVGEAADAEAALAMCRARSPDLVLLDVEMPGEDGISLAGRLARLARPPAVVYVTAFAAYAVDAFAVEARDYLVKPVRAERLAHALERVRASLPLVTGGRRQLSARIGDRLQVIPVEQIRLLIAEDKYTCVHHLEGTALVEDSLVALEQEFPGDFVRIHRNALVARNHLRELVREPDGRTCVRIAGCPETPEVSRRNLPGLRRVLTGDS